MRGSSFERVVGDVSEAEKERILREKAEYFDNERFEIVVAEEREKTPTELRIISLANRFTNELRRRYGLDDFDIPPGNIHVIKEDARAHFEGPAVYNPSLQMVAVREDHSRIGFLHRMVHEMLHFKSYQALQVTTGAAPEVAEYRAGLVAKSRDGARTYFTGLNEAVTEELTKLVVLDHARDPLFAKEMETTRVLAQRHSQRAKTDSGEPLFNEDTYYGSILGRTSWREAIGHLIGASEKSKGTIETRHFSYRSERRMLGALIDVLFARNPARFQRRDEVFDLFARGMMTGNLLPLGRLIDSTFGKGTFRRIGELSGDRDAQLAFVQALAQRKA